MGRNLSCILTMVVLVSSCSAFTRTEPPSTIGLYGSEPIPQTVPNSKAQGFFSLTLGYSSEEVLEATLQSMLKQGYNMELVDREKNIVTASDYDYCGAKTMAIYIKQLSPKPETALNVILDQYDDICSELTVSMRAGYIANDIEEVLSTY